MNFMAAKTTRLDRLLSKAMSIKKADVRQIAATGGILVDGVPCKDVSRVVNMFSTIAVDGKCYQDIRPRYIMLNKPAGYVSATADKKHKTVFDLVQIDNPQNLHIAGRLDLNSTGLLLLTNDSRWSEALTAPNKNVAKVYRVVLKHPIGPDYQEAFRKGMFFPYEGITTQPAKLKIIDERVAKVSLIEGKYHQIKRMFGRFRNPVIALHRMSVGGLRLDDGLGEGQYRDLTPAEVLAALDG